MHLNNGSYTREVYLLSFKPTVEKQSMENLAKYFIKIININML